MNFMHYKITTSAHGSYLLHRGEQWLFGQSFCALFICRLLLEYSFYSKMVSQFQCSSQLLPIFIPKPIQLRFSFSHSLTESGTVGMAITQIMTLVMAIQWGMRQTAELENNMTSVERIMEYVDLEPEEDLIIENHKLDEWPKTGNMEFINLTMKYSAYSKPTLKSLNLTIKSGEKIGKFPAIS